MYKRTVFGKRDDVLRSKVKICLSDGSGSIGGDEYVEVAQCVEQSGRLPLLDMVTSGFQLLGHCE